jgi:hypothetical protein
MTAFLDQPAPPAGASAALRALWHVAQGDWAAAHELVQAGEGQPDCDWVHAHLHRVEGDAGNAAYWYRRAGQPVPRLPVAEERDRIVAALCSAGEQ